jgi:hypothetical protein
LESERQGYPRSKGGSVDEDEDDGGDDGDDDDDDNGVASGPTPNDTSDSTYGVGTPPTPGVLPDRAVHAMGSEAGEPMVAYGPRRRSKSRRSTSTLTPLPEGSD